MDTVSNLTNIYADFWERRDRRMDNWPLMDSPLPTMLLCGSYVLIVKVIGPKIMENRKPLDIKGFLIFYNLFQVVLSTYIFVEVRVFFLTAHTFFFSV